MESELRALRRFLSSDPEATLALGRALGLELVSGAVVALDGELGSGKSVLVRGIARGLGVEGPVTSPTFTLMQEHEGRVPFFHFDAWMSGRESLFLQGGGADYFGADGVTAIEWSDRVTAFLPRPHVAIRLRHRSPEERWIEIGVAAAEPGAGPSAQALSEALVAAVAGLPVGPGLEELSESGGEPGAPPSVEPPGAPPEAGTPSGTGEPGAG